MEELFHKQLEYRMKYKISAQSFVNHFNLPSHCAICLLSPFDEKTFKNKQDLINILQNLPEKSIFEENDKLSWFLEVNRQKMISCNISNIILTRRYLLFELTGPILSKEEAEKFVNDIFINEISKNWEDYDCVKYIFENNKILPVRFHFLA